MSILSVAFLSSVFAGCTVLHASSARNQIPQDTLEILPIVHQSPDARLISVNRSFEQSGLRLTIDEISLKETDVSVKLTIHNRTARSIRFYPNQGVALLGTQTLPANIFLSDSTLSGAFDPGEQQSGAIVFSVPYDEKIVPSQLNALQFSLGKVFDMKTVDPQVFQVAIPLS
ncbi:MAG: hypothetical protein ACFE0J_10540 [Elainellaceae cyanobacterium]